MKEVFTKQIEREEYKNDKIDLSLFRKRSSAKSYRGWLIGQMKKAIKEGNQDVAMILQTCYKKYMNFSTISRKNIKGVLGKSTFDIIKKPDRFEVRVWQRPDKNSEPKYTDYVITKKQVNLVLNSIYKCYDNKKIPTKDIAREYCVLSGLVENSHKMRLFKAGEFIFENFFSARADYIPFNICLRLLDKLKCISYIGGFTLPLKDKFEIQLVLS